MGRGKNIENMKFVLIQLVNVDLIRFQFSIKFDGNKWGASDKLLKIKCKFALDTICHDYLQISKIKNEII